MRVFRKTIKNLFVFILILSWIFSGWPRIGNFPPKIREAQAVAPTYVNSGASVTGTAAITVGLPANIAVDDILLLFLETSNQAITIATPNGGTWTEVTNSPQGTGTAATTTATRLTVFWSRYNGTQTAPVTSDSGNRQLGIMIAVRGVITTGNPWDITSGGVDAVANTSGVIPGATTTVADTFIVTAIGTALPDATGTANFSAWTNADLTGITERADNTSTSGVGGGLGIATSTKASIGAYGNTTVTLASSSVKAMMSIALKPQPDTTPPTPNPMTFATAPANDSASQISMIASTATDSETPPVNYLFTLDNTNCGVNAGTGGTTSAWQASTSYSDTLLQPNQCYGYTVTARDSVATPNVGTASGISSAYTSANTPGTPTLSAATVSTLSLTNAENSNPAANPTTNFAVQVTTTTPSDATWLNQWVDATGNPSAAAVWLTDAQLDALVLQGLNESTIYGVKVKARNQDNDETPLSAEGQGTTSTDTTPPTPNPMTFATAPANDSASQISMIASTATDSESPPVNYLFTLDNTNCGINAGTGGTSSAWQASTSYSDTLLQPNQCYGYTVKARDSANALNETTASGISSAYTSANIPGTPTLNGATLTTLNLTNAENSNPAANPITNFAVQVVTTTPNDAVWLNQWVNATGNPSAAAVWLTDAQLDALVLQGLQPSTTYGVKVKARNQDNDETALSAEGQGVTLSLTPTSFNQTAYRWYVDNDLTNPTDPWGNPNLGENTAITAIPIANDPPSNAQELRLRINFTVNGAALGLNSKQFKIQFKAGTDSNCTTGSWTDVGAVASSAWQFASSGIADGADITEVLTTTTTGKGEEYAKTNPTQTNHVTANIGEIIEYDFHIIGSGSDFTSATKYSFRVVESAGTLLDSYTTCPTLTTEPGTENLMRHGNFFSGGTEQGFFWAN